MVSSRNRFIPAWAGNRSVDDENAVAVAVHPRVGGEQVNGQEFRLSLTGSSPRGRGTGRSPTARAIRSRFIPAWAGNRGLPVVVAAARSVHPRVGGEQILVSLTFMHFSGSSPRGRGTGDLERDRHVMARFIPAWAGNSQIIAQGIGEVSVHPRVGGEQKGKNALTDDFCGSSPRGRGTAVHQENLSVDLRFIPAWAGNRFQLPGLSDHVSVHPRVGGEQVCRLPRAVRSAGSSPRGRGTGEVPMPLCLWCRFIPAWAGNRRHDAGNWLLSTVHPRVGGEQTK